MTVNIYISPIYNFPFIFMKVHSLNIHGIIYLFNATHEESHNLTFSHQVTDAPFKPTIVPIKPTGVPIKPT